MQNQMRVLFQNRPNAFTHRGGDTVVMERTAEELRKLGVEVTIDQTGAADPRGYDLVHLFNFVLADLIKLQGTRAKDAGVPFVVTSLCEDIPSFHNQSIAAYEALRQYMQSGDETAWVRARAKIQNAQSCGMPDNRWVIDHAAAIIANGNAEAEVVRSVYGSNANVQIVPVGCNLGAKGDAGLFTRTFGVKDFVLCVGRLETRKNQLMLLKALEHDDVTVVLVAGSFSYQAEYEKAVREFRRAGQTLILGKLSEEDLAGAYAAAKVHVLPSWYEIPGMVSLEAANQGCNVVVSRTGTTPDYFREFAIYCDADNDLSIRNGVLAAYYAPVRPELQTLAARYSWAEAGRQTLRVYDSVVRSRSRTTVTSEARTAQQNPQQSAAVASSGAHASPDELTRLENSLSKIDTLARTQGVEAALACLIDLEKEFPAVAKVARFRGAILLSLGRAAESIEHFERAIKINPKEGLAYVGQGMAHKQLANTEAAITCIARGLEILPTEVIALRELVQLAYSSGRFTELEKALSVHLASKSDDIDMQFCLAGCLFKQGKWDEATNALQRVTNAQPQYRGAAELSQAIQNSRPQVREKESGVSRASIQPGVQSAVQPAVSSTPTAASAQASSAPKITKSALQAAIEKLNQGFERKAAPESAASPVRPATRGFDAVDEKLVELDEEKRKGKYESVLPGCETVLRNPNIAPHQRALGLAIMGDVAALKGGFVEAETAYAEALKADECCARARCGQGALALHRNQIDEAWRLFEQALAVDAKCDIAWAGKGMVAQSRSAHEEAWRYFTQALAINVENSRAILGMIGLAYHLNRLAELELVLEKYLDLHSADLEFLYAMAGCQYAQGKLEEASQHISTIRLFKPEHESANELAGLIAQKRGGHTYETPVEARV